MGTVTSHRRIMRMRCEVMLRGSVQDFSGQQSLNFRAAATITGVFGGCIRE
jgi:hypothetical protein